MLGELTHPDWAEPLDDFLARTAWVVSDSVVSKFGALYLDQLDDPGPEHSFLVEGWISIGDKSVIAGESRSGKTFFALELALAVAHGRPLFGLQTERGGVIYQVGEGARGIKKRLRAWRFYHGVQFGRDTPFVLLQKQIDLYRNPDQIDALIEEINAHAKNFAVPLKLVVIDTMATATVGADENSVKDMGAVLENVAKISAKTGAHVTLVHHMNASGAKIRGHTSVYGNMDQVLLVKRDPQTKIRTIVLDKQKDEAEGATLRFELIPVVLGLDETGRQVSSCVCLAVGDKEAIYREEAVKGLRMTPSNEVFMKAFFAAEQRFGFPVPPDMSLPAKVRALTPWSDIKKVYEEMSPPDGVQDEQETTAEAELNLKRYREMMKKRIASRREELLAAGVIEIMDYKIDDRVISVAYHTGKPLRAFPLTYPRPEITAADPALDIPF